MMLRSRTGIGVVAGVVLLVAGCGSSTSHEARRATVRDSAGITIVEHAGIPTNLPSWTVSSEPVAVIGSMDGEGPDVFGRIGTLALLSDGTIVVADGASHELRAFDRHGRHLWTAGRQGGGPGEFTSLDGGYRIAGDSILAAGGGRVVSVFAPDGRYARQVRLDPPPDRYSGGPLISGATDTGHVIGSGLAMPPFEPGYYRAFLMLLFYDGNGRRTAEFGPLLYGEGVLTLPGEGGYASRMVPMSRQTQIAVARDRVAVTSQERFEITRLDPQGQVEAIIRVAVEPVRVDEAVRRRYREYSASEAGAGTALRADDEITFAEALPALGQILHDTEGRLWIEEFVPPYEGRAPVWWVLDREGDFMALVSVPRDLTLKQVGGDMVVALALDELHVPSVRVHELIRDTVP